MKLTLEKYQQLEAISNDKSLDDLDKSLFSICAMYGLSEQQLDTYKPKQVLKMANKVSKIFGKPVTIETPRYINHYRVSYAIEKITLGQYMELVHFTKGNAVINNAQYLAATMSKTLYKTEHIDRANYFLTCTAGKVISAALKIKSNFDTFNITKFRGLYEPYPEMPNDNSLLGNWFNGNFGWFFSAESVAKFEGITLDQAYRMPVIRALNNLMFLKAKNRYEYYLAHKKD